jgi:hypothetical protein
LRRSCFLCFTVSQPLEQRRPRARSPPSPPRRRSRPGTAGWSGASRPPAPGELEYVWPEPPVATGPTALSTQLEGFDCFTGFGATLETYAAGAAHARIGTLAEPVLASAAEGSTLYGLVPGPGPTPDGADSPSCTPTDPCSLERIAKPASMKLERYVPKPPFDEYFIK